MEQVQQKQPRISLFRKPATVSVISWDDTGSTETATFVFRKPATVSAISWDGTGATARNVFCSYLKLKAYNGVCYLSGMEQVHRKKLLHSTQGSAYLLRMEQVQW